MAPLLLFGGKGIAGSIVPERQLYHPRVVVKFNPTAYANSTNMVQWPEDQLVPVLDSQPTLIPVDLFSGHKTEEVLDTFIAHDITVSIIRAGCTGIVEPLDVSVNWPFKDILNVSRPVNQKQNRILILWSLGKSVRANMRHPARRFHEHFCLGTLHTYKYEHSIFEKTNSKL